ncbi:unnamed protein product [Owenia fusiformis]|uniref:TNFR-Cys domain-containing protein n=1 Tax=Owenia fusiformis TaxID=6347 RepID=A0A8S4PMC5_OWEFU|nr:unnamed protein product [Owenia fusiformis]
MKTFLKIGFVLLLPVLNFMTVSTDDNADITNNADITDVDKHWIRKCGGKSQLECDQRTHFCDDRVDKCSRCTDFCSESRVKGLTQLEKRCYEVCPVWLYIEQQEKIQEESKPNSIQSSGQSAINTHFNPLASSSTITIPPYIVIGLLICFGALCLFGTVASIVAIFAMKLYITKRKEETTKEEEQKKIMKTAKGHNIHKTSSVMGGHHFTEVQRPLINPERSYNDRHDRDTHIEMDPIGNGHVLNSDKGLDSISEQTEDDTELKKIQYISHIHIWPILFQAQFQNISMKVVLCLFVAVIACIEACHVEIDNRSGYEVGWTLVFASKTNGYGLVDSGKRHTHNCNTCLPRDIYVTWNNVNCYIYVNCVSKPTIEVNIFPQSGGRWVMNLRNTATGKTTQCPMPAPRSYV